MKKRAKASEGAAPAKKTADGPRLAKTSVASVLVAILAYAAVSLVPVLFSRMLFLETFETDGPSMEPTLRHGDLFVVDRTAIGLFFPWQTEALATWGVPEVGDVVVLRSPMDEVDIVKRVVGLPGDRVAMRAGEVLRNGASLGHEPTDDGCVLGDPEPDGVCFVEHFGDRRWHVAFAAAEADDFAEQDVPEGHVFVLGDHRDRSNDSRRIGPIPLARVIGVVRFRYFSPEGSPLGAVP